tara:strand:- start:3154 stop:4140 length:987 start_codon:yes stop_codon:yes gene_type:complete
MDWDDLRELKKDELQDILAGKFDANFTFSEEWEDGSKLSAAEVKARFYAKVKSRLDSISHGKGGRPTKAVARQKLLDEIQRDIDFEKRNLKAHRQGKRVVIKRTGVSKIRADYHAQEYTNPEYKGTSGVGGRPIQEIGIDIGYSNIEKWQKITTARIKALEDELKAVPALPKTKEEKAILKIKEKELKEQQKIKDKELKAKQKLDEKALKKFKDEVSAQTKKKQIAKAKLEDKEDAKKRQLKGLAMKYGKGKGGGAAAAGGGGAAAAGGGGAAAAGGKRNLSIAQLNHLAKMRKGKLPIMKPSTETPPKPVVIYSGVKRKIKPKKKAK